MKKDGAVDLQWMEEILRNPPPVDRWFLPLFIGFQPSKVVQDFFHPQGEQTHTHITANWYTIYTSQKNSVHGLMYKIYIYILYIYIYVYIYICTRPCHPPSPHGMGPIYCPHMRSSPSPPVVWWGCGTVPLPPLWCGGGVVLSPPPLLT